MNKLLKEKRKYSGILFIVVVVIIGILIGYNFYIQNQLEDYARDTVEQKAENISAEVDTYIDAAINSIQVTSYFATQKMSNNTLENSNEVLGELVKQTPFDFIEYINESGMNTTEKGEKFDASNRVYFQDGIKGNTGIWINYSPKYSKEYLLNFYTPLYFRNEVVGVLTGVLGVDTNILPMLKSDFFDEEMIGVMCDQDGKIIATTLDLQQGAYLDDVLSQIQIDEKNRQLLNNNLDYEKKGF